MIRHEGVKTVNDERREGRKRRWRGKMGKRKAKGGDERREREEERRKK